MTGHSTQLCLQILTSTKTGLATKISFSAIFLANQEAHQTMGAGSWQCLHAALCTQYFVICFWGKAVGYSLNIELLISKIYITLKLVIISDIFWYIWGKLSKHMERNTVRDGPSKGAKTSWNKRGFNVPSNQRVSSQGKLVLLFFASHGIRRAMDNDLEKQEDQSGEWSCKAAWPASHLKVALLKP